MPTKDIANLYKPVLQYAQRRVTALHQDQTVREALDYLRGQDLGEKIVYFYVVDSDNRLVGVVPVRRLLMSRLDITVADIMVRQIVAVRASDTLLTASELLLQHRFMAVPVVDTERHLIGVLDITLFADEGSTLARQHEIDSAFQLIGVHVSLGRNISIWSSLKDRLPWLFANIAGGLVCALILTFNESLIQAVTLLAMFIPVVLTVSESVGMQSMTLTLQSSHHRLSWRLLVSLVRRELPSAFGLGLCSAALVGLIALMWKHNFAAAAAVGAGLFVAVIVACILGVLVPGAIKLLRADPKIASGPIALAVADMVTLLLLFTFARGFLM
ncbi:magnesium transporter MgtE [candidate division GN15 bacterium]|uniref:Magnesium transporter MgtE n=1 Tax=candidate division GN15 bacterium TaxID=2072418 RepID=A0A855X704_9BACT|nr:MAG: magnesium transporter MgtE [candidate division GN15 bacterium]